MSTMREQFEAWAAEEGYPESSFEVSKDGDVRTYYDTTTEAMWEAWQAANEAAKATGTAGDLLPLPEWSKMDNLGGLVPSEIRQALREYGQACAEAREAYLMQSHAPLMDAASAKYRIEKAEAARQPAPVVAVKTWQERMFDNAEAGNQIGSPQRFMRQEIADLRAALAATNRSQP